MVSLYPCVVVLMAMARASSACSGQVIPTTTLECMAVVLGSVGCSVPGSADCLDKAKGIAAAGRINHVHAQTTCSTGVHLFVVVLMALTRASSVCSGQLLPIQHLSERLLVV